MKLYLDEDVPLELARQLQLKGHDVATPQEVGMLHSDDPDQLAFAASQQRVILTFDKGYYRLAEEWFLQGRPHSGIVISREYQPDEMRTLLSLCLNFLARETEATMANMVFRLEQYR